ncbi:fungal-specific transcription factor domain-containing protein [Aspergillus granulosus]|uniref:Fungal-specific transcription factor domain-containing protein n=1 Tax=Aspergillus granulosus TaxID=176169 RepID=A0ABR4HHJ5_9EURO
MEEAPGPVTVKLRASRRRPPRASRACETCRARKTKCDQAQPCSYCAYHTLDCVYRNVGSTGNYAPTTGRQSQLREVQRENSRPSPWPDANQGTPRHSEPSRSSNTFGSDPPASCVNDASLDSNSPVKRAPRNHNGCDIVPSSLLDSASRDGLSGVNVHTKGTEFYGTSSNFAFLQNLYARARSHMATNTSRGTEDAALLLTTNSVRDNSNANSSATTYLPPGLTAGADPRRDNAPSNKSQLSIVNLLYNPNYPTQSPPQLAAEDNAYQARTNPKNLSPDLGSSPLSIINEMPPKARIEVEKIFISSYFSNKHYIHPMLSKHSFMQRCEGQAFVPSNRTSFCNGLSRFSGLYFAVVALGAINASPHETTLLDHYCKYPSLNAQRIALYLADFYFGIAKQNLGDLFEGCSLETAQTLLLLSVFCQNALRPHSCYMYSGMAVRTAVAVGLASGISSLPPVVRKEGIRTWWCIYSHEVEMCCSSGRPDSVKDLSYYQVSLPTIQDRVTIQQEPEVEGNDIAMIPAMVSLAQIMSEASQLLYHSPKRSTGEKSRVSERLDDKLLQWKSTLPDFLNIDVASLNDPEWAFKQKLVLRLRFYNTRILINRPFLAASMSTTGNSLLPHLHTCLSAAKSTIQMQYEAFLHRIYIRTWWYNTTYALYASMILLHVILSGYPDIRDEELLADVEKSLEIFESMNNIVVARRCSEMIREVLEVARSCATRRQLQSNTLDFLSSSHASNGESGVPNPYTLGPDMASIASAGDANFFFSLFNQDSQPGTRANMLADLVDPTILENFAFGNGSNDFASFLNV